MEKKAVIVSLKPSEIIDIKEGSTVFNFEKTPKIEEPFKCYIHCKKGGKQLYNNSGEITENPLFCGLTDTYMYALAGMVIGEFIYIDGVIKDVKWYDKPKGLNDFFKPCPMKCSCSDCKYHSGGFPSLYEPPTCNYEFEEIRRAPTPWVYVEEMD